MSDGGGRSRPNLQTFSSVGLCFPAKEQSWKTSLQVGVGGWREALSTHIASSVTVSSPQQHHAHHLAVTHLGGDPQRRGSILWEKEVASVMRFQSHIHSLRTTRSLSPCTLLLICSHNRGGEEGRTVDTGPQAGIYSA